LAWACAGPPLAPPCLQGCWRHPVSSMEDSYGNSASRDSRAVARLGAIGTFYLVLLYLWHGPRLVRKVRSEKTHHGAWSL